MAEPNFKAVDWLKWMGATVVASVTLTAFAYSNFETKTDAKERKAEIVKSIDELKESIKELTKEMKDANKKSN